jgi:hypothetical protein
MSAFVAALAAVHADSNIGTPADFRRPPGPWVPVRVVLSRPTDTIGGLGGLGTRAGSLAATLLAGDIAPLEPQRGDEVMLNGTVHRVDDAERDPLGLSWHLILAET